jgi:UDPglucose 6-dehydrogenase
MAITRIARDHDYVFKIVEAVVEVNHDQRERMLEKIKGLTGELKCTQIGVLGLAFKPNTDDIRESPAIDIANMLMAQGASIKAYDPAAMENAGKAMSGPVKFCSDAYEVADGSDALLILTEWNQFRKLDLGRLKGLLKSPRIIDLRNIYDPANVKKFGFEYVCVGRGGRIHESPFRDAIEAAAFQAD